MTKFSKNADLSRTAFHVSLIAVLLSFLVALKYNDDYYTMVGYDVRKNMYLCMFVTCPLAAF